MIREGFKSQIIGANKEFRYRGTEPGRLENFSDACFALAITLLLISTSPPTTFEQVRRFVWELIPFAICITLIMLIWHEHFVFYFRYGLRTGSIIVLNSLFLVITLFYVYPLKFLTRTILLPLTYMAGDTAMLSDLSGMIRNEDWAALMIIYGLGGASTFLILAMMYRHALKKRVELELTEVEVFDTRAKIIGNVLLASVPIVSVIAAIILYGVPWAAAVAGPLYFLYTPVMFTYGYVYDKKRNRLLARLAESESQKQPSLEVT
jgi:uncharacterized membrane protein